MKEKDKNYLPYRVRVEKNLENNTLNVMPEKGFLSEVEEELFKSGMKTVLLDSQYDCIVYSKVKRSELAQIINGVPTASYKYKTHKRMYDKELRRK